MELYCSTKSNSSSFPETSTLSINILTTTTNSNDWFLIGQCFKINNISYTTNSIKSPILNWIWSGNTRGRDVHCRVNNVLISTTTINDYNITDTGRSRDNRCNDTRSNFFILKDLSISFCLSYKVNF